MLSLLYCGAVWKVLQFCALFLLQTIRDPRPAPAPKAVRMAEAEKLGVFDTAALASVAPRTVPASAKEFAINRSKYQKEVSFELMLFCVKHVHAQAKNASCNSMGRSTRCD